MTKNLSLLTMTLMTLGWLASDAHARVIVRAPENAPTASVSLLADNVVVAPAPTTPAPAAAQPTAPAEPTSAPPAATTVVEPPRTTKVVHADVTPTPNYMGTVAVSALMGAVVGVLTGTAIYYLANNVPARDIAYWGAGGVLLGAGVGVVQVVVQESRASSAVALNRLPEDPAPTLRVALFRATF